MNYCSSIQASTKVSSDLWYWDWDWPQTITQGQTHWGQHALAIMKGMTQASTQSLAGQKRIELPSWTRLAWSESKAVQEMRVFVVVSLGKTPLELGPIGRLREDSRRKTTQPKGSPESVLNIQHIYYTTKRLEVAFFLNILLKIFKESCPRSVKQFINSVKNALPTDTRK